MRMKILPLLPNQENQPDPRFYAAAVSPGVKEEEVEVGMAAAADSQHASFLFEILNNKISRGTLPTGSHLKGMSSTHESRQTSTGPPSSVEPFPSH
jgi:hypothetical protein